MEQLVIMRFKTLNLLSSGGTCERKLASAYGINTEKNKRDYVNYLLSQTANNGCILYQF